MQLLWLSVGLELRIVEGGSQSRGICLMALGNECVHLYFVYFFCSFDSCSLGSGPGVGNLNVSGLSTRPIVN